ncbi:MAG: purine-nucleoside phosphorylase [Clostridiales bacterium]|nr:purine-nucleoside phosphorylase [Clostridiales bacterium]
MQEKINESIKYIESKIKELPKIGLILGSGLGDLADEIVNPVVIEYKDIPYFPVSTVEGHKGQLVIGELMGKRVMAMQGRLHYYEGYSMQDVTYPVRVMKKLGIDTLIVTNACGGMNPKLYPGALMLITDHINMMGDNPLMGKNLDDFGPRFPDMSSAYNPKLIDLGKKVAKDLDIDVQEGVYSAISGPYFLTKAELKMLRILGGDAVGMSTVPEVIVANHSGIKTLGISCVTDMAIADTLEPIDHETVMRIANETKPKFFKYVKGILKEVE